MKAEIKKLKNKLNSLRHPLRANEAKKLGDVIVAEMKTLISKGFSPIQGGGLRAKFGPYGGLYPKKPGQKTYPDTVKHLYPGKKRNPVNLKLSGDFLDDFKSRVIPSEGAFAVEIGFSKDSEIVKEEGHRMGGSNTYPNSQHKRPIIPIPSRKETFAESVQQAYSRLVSEVINRIARS